MARFGKFLMTAFLVLAAAAGIAADTAPQGETVIIADGCGLSATGNAAWVESFARAAGGEVVNASRPGWKSSDVWYVREILGGHPRAAAYVLLASPEDLRSLSASDPETVARAGARYGYMADIIMEANPRARVLLAAPPQVDPVRHPGYPATAPMLSEMFAASLGHVAETRSLRFVNLLESFPETGDDIFPTAAGEQERLGKTLALELRDPAAPAALPDAAAVAVRMAPPAAGRPVTDNAGADALAAAVAADLAALPGLGVPAPEKTAPSAPAVIRSYICERDLSQVASEEGVCLAQGVADCIRDILASGLDEEEEMRMNAAFNFPGADEYAQISREPPVNEAVISAIVPPAAAQNVELAGSVVDWDAVPAPESPAFNAVALARAEKTDRAASAAPQGVRADDFSDDPDAVSVPGMSVFSAAAEKTADETESAEGEILTNVVREPVVIRDRGDAPQQDLSDAPWNRPVEVAAVTPENPAAPAAESASAPAAPLALAGPDPEFLPDCEGGLDDIPAVKMEALFNGEATLSGTGLARAENASATLSRWVNREDTMLPLRAEAAPRPAIPGYAVYIHTAAE